MPDLRVALVSDTHVRPPYDDGQQAFASDASHNARNEVVAEAVRALAPDVLVHLGDVVHPIPTLPAHADALQIAHGLYAGLGCPLLVVPGNHDVGDKRGSASAPEQAAAARDAFEATWGPVYRSLEVDGVRLVVVDGGLLGGDGPRALAQRAWLEQTLAAGGRTFVFTHYPPYLCDPDEHEHYDNLPPRVRGWLLDLLADAGVEALFSGHVHRFFYNRYRGVDLYTLPSVAFARPEYAALRPVPPVDAEHGRDDTEQLGWASLTITDRDHRLDLHPPFSRAPGPPARPQPLGTWLRHRLGRRSELPLGDLDALTRKVARDDRDLVQVLDLGLTAVRVPLADLDDADVRARVAWLARQGVATHLFTAGLPTAGQTALHRAYGAFAPWEVVCRPADHAALRQALSAWTGPALTLGRIGRSLQAEGSYFSHFPGVGFDPDDPAVAPLIEAAAPGAVEAVAFRIADGAPIAERVARAVAQAEALGVRATCHVELPFGAEDRCQDDDDLVVERVQAAATAAETHPGARVFVDLLRDKDRGYWPRHGLVDPADRPRPAYLALKARARRTRAESAEAT